MCLKVTTKKLQCLCFLFCKKCFPQEVEAGMEVENTTTDSDVSGLPVTDSVSEESQAAPNKKAPVRFGWVTGVMVSEGYVRTSAT